MRSCPSPPAQEPRRGDSVDGYATLRRKRIEASEIKDACAAWMRSCGARATVAQRVANAERMQRCFRVMSYCAQRMGDMDRESEAIRSQQRAFAGAPVAFPGMQPMVERVVPKTLAGKRKADDRDISRRAHAYRNIGEASRKRKREPPGDRDVEDEDLEEYQSEYRSLYPALDDGRRGIKGLYGPGDVYY